MRACPGCHRVWQEAHDYCPSDGTPLVLVRPDEDPLVGLVLDGRYRLLTLLGTGGMGFVYRAEQVGLGRRVAVKMLFAERTRDHASIKRFQREAHALATLDHPGIVRVIDYGDFEGRTPYLAMQEAEGPPLDTVLHGRGALPPRVAVAVGAQLAEALAAAHRARIVHRDLKPANVHLAWEAGGVRARVLDFGLAQLIAEQEDLLSAETRLTRKGTVFGTPEYMAPEQVRGVGADHRTDLYALGVVVFEMLTGRPPFTGSTASRVLAQHTESPPPALRVRGVDPVLVARLDAVVRGLLAKRPADRAQPAGDVAAQLRAIETTLPADGVDLGFLAVDAGSTTPHEDTLRLADDLSPFEGVATAADADRALEATLAADRRGRRVRFVLGAVVVLALLAGLVPVGLGWLRAGWAERGPRAVTPVGPVLTRDQAPRGQPLNAAQLPGGEPQARYEATLRGLQATLAARGLRDADLRMLPQARALWLAQARAARSDRFDEAASTVDALRRLADSVPTAQILRLRLGDVKARRAGDPALDRLEADLDAAAASARGTRDFLERLGGIDGPGGSG